MRESAGGIMRGSPVRADDLIGRESQLDPNSPLLARQLDSVLPHL